MTMYKWDFKKLSTVKYETNSYEINESYQNISVCTDTADVVLVPSEGKKSEVVCYEHKHVKHSVSVKDDTLVIEAVDTRKWYEYIGIDFSVPKITIYIPQAECGALSIKTDTGAVKVPESFKFKSAEITVCTGDVTNKASVSEDLRIMTSTGDICVQNISVRNVELSVSTGKIAARSVTCNGDIGIEVSTGDALLADVSCKNLSSRGSTGDLSMEHVVAADRLSIERNTGDINFDSCDAADIFMKTSTGKIAGSLLSDKVFITHSDTGSIDVPKTITGGRCELTTDTGNIKIEIK